MMKAEHGFDLPRRLQIEFSKTIQHITEDSGTEISPVVMWEAFQQNYLPAEPRFRLNSHELRSDSATGRTSITAQLVVDGAPVTIIGEGNGPIDAFVHALREGVGAELERARLRRARDRSGLRSRTPSPTSRRRNPTATCCGASASTRTSSLLRCAQY